MRTRSAIVIGAMLVGCGDSSGPGGDARSVTFFVAFPTNEVVAQDAELSVRLVGEAGVTGTLSVPGLAHTTGFTIGGSGQAVVAVPAEAMLDAWDTVQARGVIIEVSDSVFGIAIHDKPGTMHTAVLVPATALGTQHRILAAGAGGQVEGSYLAIAATEDGTQVTITPSVAAGTRAAGTAFQIMLDRGDAYQLRATGTAGDLTGSAVTANRPIAVYAGHVLGQVPGPAGYGAFLWAAMPPVAAVAGTEFVTLPLAGRANYRIRVMALADNTTITSSGYTGAPSSLPVAGQVVEAAATGPGTLLADRPVLLAQLAEGGSVEPVIGADPCYALVAPVTRRAAVQAFVTPDNQVGARYANVVVPVAATAGVRVNGDSIPAARFTTIPGTGYAGAVDTLPAGVVAITAATTGANVMVYGWDTAATGANGFCFATPARF